MQVWNRNAKTGKAEVVEIKHVGRDWTPERGFDALMVDEAVGVAMWCVNRIKELEERIRQLEAKPLLLIGLLAMASLTDMMQPGVAGEQQSDMWGKPFASDQRVETLNGKKIPDKMQAEATHMKTMYASGQMSPDEFVRWAADYSARLNAADKKK